MRHRPILLTTLAAVATSGAMGAPLISPIRETLQQEIGISRAALGLGFFVASLLGAGITMSLALAWKSSRRTTLFRIGATTMSLALFGIASLPFLPGWSVWALGGAWIVVAGSHTLFATANGIFMDLWSERPRTGVILLHAGNSIGKVSAPLAVLAFGPEPRLVAIFFGSIFLLCAIFGWAWPRSQVAEIDARERSVPSVGIPREPLIWICLLQFFFVAGAEAGAVSIVGSLVEVQRPSPIEALGQARWGAVVLTSLLLGIFFGRVLFTGLSGRMSERAIMWSCMGCGFAACVPAATSSSPAIFLLAQFLTGIAFSATWPAYFSLVGQVFPQHRTFLSMGAALSSVIGISGCTALSSAIGNVDERLPMAFLASVAILLPFAAFLLSPVGRRLGPASG